MKSMLYVDVFSFGQAGDGKYGSTSGAGGYKITTIDSHKDGG